MKHISQIIKENPKYQQFYNVDALLKKHNHLLDKVSSELSKPAIKALNELLDIERELALLEN